MKRLLAFIARLSVEDRQQMAMAGMLPLAVALIASDKQDVPRTVIAIAALISVPSALAFAYLAIRHPVPRAFRNEVLTSLPGLEAVARRLGLSRGPNDFHGVVRGVPVALGTLANILWIDVSSGHPPAPKRAFTTYRANHSDSEALISDVERRVDQVLVEVDAACKRVATAPSVFDRRDAIRALTMMLRTPPAMAQLESALREADVRVRLPAALALDRIDALVASDIPALLDLTTGVDIRGRADACVALGRIGDASTLAALVEIRSRGETDAEPLTRAISAIAERIHVAGGELAVASAPPDAGAVSVAAPRGALSRDKNPCS